MYRIKEVAAAKTCGPLQHGSRLPYNLQFFAKEGPGGEKTEEPTEKKLSDARKEGNVAKSKELGNATGLIALFLILRFWAGSMGRRFIEIFHAIYNKIPELLKIPRGQLEIQDMTDLINQVILLLLIMLLPIFAIGLVVAFISDLVQVKWKPTTKPLKPKFKNMNPISGFKKIFSPNSLMELLKSILKIGLITYVAYSTLKEYQDVIFALYDIPLWPAIINIGLLTIDLGMKISIFYLVLGLLDFAYQKFKFKKDMKMTKQEVKDEYKNAEGDPQVKGKIKQRMREASQRRMMQSVPQADVVITNPTHYAVAVQYDSETMIAPLVVAKGKDVLARRIKDLAKESQVEIVENKPLARMLYHNVEIGEAVPPELYNAVAEVLAFVYSLKK